MGSGPKCFAIPRTGDDPRLQHRCVRLTGNLLVIGLQGSVVIERGDYRLPINEGGACIVSPGDFFISEIPDRVGRFQSCMLFFNRAAVKQVLKRHRNLAALAAYAATQPSIYKGAYPQNNLETQRFVLLMKKKSALPLGLADILLLLFLSGCASAMMFLRDGSYAGKQDAHTEDTLNKKSIEVTRAAEQR